MNSIPTENHGHFPVMLSETINNLNILETGFYIDGTVGLGGHSYAILQNLKNGENEDHQLYLIFDDVIYELE